MLLNYMLPQYFHQAWYYLSSLMNEKLKWKYMLSFINCLDDIIKQFTIVGSMKEQQSQQHKEYKYFPRGNHKGENPAKLPRYRT